MRGRNKKTSADQKDLTAQYLSGALDEDRVDQEQRFTSRSKHGQQDKIMRTATMRAEATTVTAQDVQSLPIGNVVQVYSRYCNVISEGKTYLCGVRKTMVKVQGEIVVGDLVRFRPDPADPKGEAVVEQILPRRTLLTRADSFKAIASHPIVANADQVLIVASLVHPRPKWGLIDRMLVAARGGGLETIVCLNKIDLASEDDSDIDFARGALAHYASALGVKTLEASVEQSIGIEALRELLRGKTTVLAGHSGVGKSSLIRAVQPGLDIRVGEVSQITQKGRHTTTSARRYPLGDDPNDLAAGAVVDTPGVKLFGLWNVTAENLLEHFPDVEAETAPSWRVESYQRILASLPSSSER
jgi:ribosome biogenesis GTPase / thiamine phosphate phosphatase